MANSVTSFILGALTVLVLAAGAYIYYDFSRSQKTVANYNVDSAQPDTYIYDKDDKVMEKAIDESISKNLNSDVVPTKKGVISGNLCYPSEILPSGKVVAKNTSTDEITEINIDGTSTAYSIQVDPGIYNLRYEANPFGDSSPDKAYGYYTKCSINSDANTCNANGGHDLIPVKVSAGETKSDIKLCDFYYSDQPDF